MSLRFLGGEMMQCNLERETTGLIEQHTHWHNTSMLCRRMMSDRDHQNTMRYNDGMKQKYRHLEQVEEASGFDSRTGCRLDGIMTKIYFSVHLARQI